MTFATDAQTAPQISMAAEGGAGAPVPDISVEADKIDDIRQRTVAAGFKIEYGPRRLSLGASGGSTRVIHLDDWSTSRRISERVRSPAFPLTSASRRML
jgi:hypothetical protein